MEGEHCRMEVGQLSRRQAALIPNGGRGKGPPAANWAKGGNSGALRGLRARGGHGGAGADVGLLSGARGRMDGVTSGAQITGAGSRGREAPMGGVCGARGGDASRTWDGVTTIEQVQRSGSNGQGTSRLRRKDRRFLGTKPKTTGRGG